MSLSVLIVAPTREDLPLVQDEAGTIVRLLSAHPLIGEVTVHDLMAAVEVQQFDVLWFATHGTEDGIAISPTLTLTGGTLAQLVRRSAAKYVFLNSCESENVASDLYGRVQVPIVCTVGMVGDTDAYITARNFAGYLSRGLSFRDAYMRSRSASFRLIPDGLMYDREDESIRLLSHRNRMDIDRIQDTLQRILDAEQRRERERATEALERRDQQRAMRQLQGISMALMVMMVLQFAVSVYIIVSLNNVP